MSKRILIVDDSRVSRMIIRTFMAEMQPDWEYYEAENAQAAFEFLGRQAVELVTLDINMPGMSGLAASEQIKLSAASTAIAFLTSNAQKGTREKAVALGAHLFEKPITRETIANVLALVAT